MAITGTASADTLVGTGGADLIEGLGGDDRITGHEGNDTLRGGSGNDIFYIGGTDFGTDIFDGGDGTDAIRLNGDVSVSSLLLNRAHLTSVETLDFSSYDISGTEGGDVIDISGVNRIAYSSVVDLGDGADRFVGHVGSDRAYGASGADTLNGGSGDDSLEGGSGNDSLLGGSGNDVFYIAGTDFGTDIFDGGDGTDAIRLNGDVSVSRLLLDRAHLTSVETLDFSSYDISGTEGGDVIDISGVSRIAYSSVVDLGDGVDRFVGHVGSDRAYGASGADTLNGGSGDDSLWGGEGNDSLLGGSGSDVFYIGGAPGADIYNGGAGTDVVRLSSDVVMSRFIMNSHNVIATEKLDFSSYDIEGTSGNDIFDISGFAEVVNGRIFELDLGNDRFTGHRGDDRVEAGAGRDTMIGGAGDDLLDGEEGVDLASYAAASGGVRVNLAVTTAQLIGGGQGRDVLLGVENLNGSAYADVLTGSAAANVLAGGAGIDLLTGGAGNDTLNGGYGRDTAGFGGATGGVTVNLAATRAQAIGGGQGTDLLTLIENVNGSRHGDRLDGSAAANTLNGAGGADVLHGAAGNDLLRGGAGNDGMAGGTGADVFVFAVNEGADRISDWQDGIDSIRIAAGSWQGAVYDSFDDLHIGQSGANAVIRLGGTSITLAGTDADVLGASDFHFV